jgi:predicted DNA-binding protein
MDPATSNSTTSDDPVVTGDTADEKNEIGTFVVTDEQGAPSAPENPGTTLEARLDQISTPTQDTKIAGLKEASEHHAQEEKEAEDLPSIPNPVEPVLDGDKKSETLDTVTVEANDAPVNSVPPTETKESPVETHTTPESPVALPTQPPLSSEAQSPQSESYHTISGGPETLKEITDKTHANDIVGTGRRSSTTLMGMPVVIKEESTSTKKEPSLGAALFIFLVFVNFSFFVFSLGSPMLLDYCVENQYLIVKNDGSYYHIPSQIAFAKTLPDTALHFTIELTLLSFIMVFIAGVIDVAGGRTRFSGKVFTFLLIIGLLSAIFYFLVSNGFDVMTFVRTKIPSIPL